MALEPAALKALAIELSAAMPPAPSEAFVSLPVLDPSPRARAMRRISEIANARGWHIEVTRTLDKHRAAYVSDLHDAEIFALRDRMERFEDCVQFGCDPADAPPAL